MNVKLLKYSSSKYGKVMSVLMRFPTVKLAELRTHRVLSQHEGECIETCSNDQFLSMNANSSRAIPITEQIKSAKENSYEPIWTSKKSGMQGDVIDDDRLLEELSLAHYQQMLSNLDFADRMDRVFKVHKQDATLTIHPYTWTSCIVTGDAKAWEHFFELRCPKYTTPVSGEGFYARSKQELISWHSNEINLKILEDPNFDWNSINSSMTYPMVQSIAEEAFDLYMYSTPTHLEPGEWHIVFDDKSLALEQNLAQSMSKCALISYDNQDKEEDIVSHVNRARRLVLSGHWSTAEHQMRVPYPYELQHLSSGFQNNEYVTGKYVSSTRGWIRLRELLGDEITI